MQQITQMLKFLKIMCYGSSVQRRPKAAGETHDLTRWTAVQLCWPLPRCHHKPRSWQSQYQRDNAAATVPGISLGRRRQKNHAAVDAAGRPLSSCRHRLMTVKQPRSSTTHRPRSRLSANSERASLTLVHCDQMQLQTSLEMLRLCAI